MDGKVESTVVVQRFALLVKKKYAINMEWVIVVY